MMITNQEPRPVRRSSPQAAGRRSTIGLFSDDFFFHIPIAFLRGVDAMARQSDVNLVYVASDAFCSPQDYQIQSNIFYDLIGADNVDAVLLATNLISGFAPPEALQALYHRYHPLPVISLGLAIDGLPSVILDNAQGMQAAVSHLIEAHGHRRIAFVQGPIDHPDAQERYQAYVTALTAHAIPLDPRLVLPGDFQAAAGQAAIRILLDERGCQPRRDVDAIVTANDTMALAAILALQARRIRIPEDLAVVGFDNSPTASAFTPPLTSVHAAFEEVGRQGVALVLAQLAGEPVPAVVSIPTQLVVRQSCGCAPRQESLTVAGRGSSDDMRGALNADPMETLRQLNRGIQAPRDIAIWESALAVLRRYAPLMSATPSDAPMAAAFADIWSALSRTASATFEDSQYDLLKEHAGRALISTVDLGEITNILAARLPALGIQACYLALYENPPPFRHPQAAPEWSRLHLAYTPAQRFDLPPEGVRFRSRELVPRALLPQEARYTLITVALYFQQHQIGFILFGTGTRDESLYLDLQGQISGALQGALLVRQTQQDAAAIADKNAELIRKQYILDAFMANIPDSIYFKDRDSRFIRVNTAIVRNLGRTSPADFIGKRDFDFFPEDVARPAFEDEQEILRTGQPILAKEECRPNGAWMLTTKMPLLDETGAVIGTFGMSRDITPLKQAQRELEQHAHELAAAYQEIRILNDQLNDDNVRMHTEMDLARRIQTALLPQSVHDVHPDFAMAAMMLPAEEVGGDYYDITLDRNGQLWFGIGDVSGHGVTPGLIMMMAQTVHTAITTNYQATAQEIVCMINAVLFKNVHDRLGADHFMTFVTLKYLGQGRFQYAGAHLDMIVYRRRSQQCDLIATKGVWLNFVPEIAYATHNAEFMLDVGDVLVLYTDGLTEAFDVQGQMLDTHGLTEIVRRHAEDEVEALRDAILADVLAWCGNKRADDMSLVVARRVK